MAGQNARTEHGGQDMEHKRLRREKCGQREKMPEKEREARSEAIAERMMGTQDWKDADALLIYVSFGQEVSTRRLIRQALAAGKRVYCPKVEGREMNFYRIDRTEDLKPGFRGILEPSESGELFQGISPGGKALLVAPGTVFDRNGHRIGYGGGFYDRYLSRFLPDERPLCIGICFACQLAERIEPKEHDISMDEVIYA